MVSAARATQPLWRGRVHLLSNYDNSCSTIYFTHRVQKHECVRIFRLIFDTPAKSDDCDFGYLLDPHSLPVNNACTVINYIFIMTITYILISALLLFVQILQYVSGDDRLGFCWI